MYRKALLELLLDNPSGVNQIARSVGESPSDVAGDLKHLLRSLKHTEHKAVIDPARCRACSFMFSQEKLTKPSKCPQCHSTWIDEPRISVVRK